MLKVTEPVRWQTRDSILVFLSSAPHLGTFPCYSAMTWPGGRVQSHTGYSPDNRRLKVECGMLGRGPVCVAVCKEALGTTIIFGVSHSAGFPLTL